MERISTNHPQLSAPSLAATLLEQLNFAFPRPTHLAPFLAAGAIAAGSLTLADERPAAPSNGAAQSGVVDKPDAAKTEEKITPANDRERTLAQQARTEGRLIGKIETLIATLRTDIPAIGEGLKGKDAETVRDWTEYSDALDTKLTKLQQKLDASENGLDLRVTFDELKTTMLALKGWQRLAQPHQNQKLPTNTVGSAAVPERLQIEIGDPASFALWQQLGPLIQGNIDRALRGEALEIPKPTPAQLEQARSWRENARQRMLQEGRSIKERMKGTPAPKTETKDK